jgi:hypothetical protein
MTNYIISQTFHVTNIQIFYFIIKMNMNIKHNINFIFIFIFAFNEKISLLN